MQMLNEWLRAADVRTSRRTYLEEEISPDALNQILNVMESCNREGGLSIRFIASGAETFGNFNASYGMFRGVKSYFAIAGKKELADLKVLSGYYGELLVLECTSHNLGTCWVSGSYDKQVCAEQIGLSADEELVCVIPFGKVSAGKSLKERVMSVISLGSKKPEELIQPDSGLPDWVMRGLECAVKAPSAMNKQPVRFEYRNPVISAHVESDSQKIDLGIAMAHFELGAWSAGSKGKWSMQGGKYIFQ
jgi:nitroreductase